ncbi:MAG: hypothetical protein CL862_04195 [Cyanobium sp. NAT70]|nr:hypothetical protein [Cyanobium sp. NAT70]
MGKLALRHQCCQRHNIPACNGRQQHQHSCCLGIEAACWQQPSPRLTECPSPSTSHLRANLRAINFKALRQDP